MIGNSPRSRPKFRGVFISLLGIFSIYSYHTLLSIPTRDIIINLINRIFASEIDMGKNLADVEYKMRMTQDLKDKIVESAKEHNRSMNADIVARLEDSFLATVDTANSQADIKIIPLSNGKKRVIYGKLLNTLDLDYTQSLSDLKVDIELALETLSRSSIWKALQFLTKDVIVAQGNSHLNIVDNGKKGLGWLVIEDHYGNRDAKND